VVEEKAMKPKIVKKGAKDEETQTQLFSLITGKKAILVIA